VIKIYSRFEQAGIVASVLDAATAEIPGCDGRVRRTERAEAVEASRSGGTMDQKHFVEGI
jgi:hypothetical protein